MRGVDYELFNFFNNLTGRFLNSITIRLSQNYFQNLLANYFRKFSVIVSLFWSFDTHLRNNWNTMYIKKRRLLWEQVVYCLHSRNTQYNSCLTCMYKFVLGGISAGIYVLSYKRFYNEQKMVRLLQSHSWRCVVTFARLGSSKWVYCCRWKIGNILSVLNPLMPDIHYIIINTWRNLHLKTVVLFNYVWPFIEHQAIKG